MARVCTATSAYLYNANAVVTQRVLTLSAWVYALDTNGGAIVGMSKGSGEGTRNSIYLSLRNTDKVNIIQFVDGAFKYMESSNTFSTNTWIHIMCELISNGTGYIGLNGTQTDSAGSHFGSTPPSNLDTTSIGAMKREDGSFDAGFNGWIANAAIWSYPLPTSATYTQLAKGYVPLFFELAYLEAYWPMIGRTSPEIDIVGGYDMTLVGGPTTAAHPRVMYPVSPQIISIPTVGGGTLGRMYSVSNTVAGVTAATDLLRISAPTDAVVAVHKVIVTQETEFGDAASEQVDVMFHRGSTDGSGGATPTASPLEVGDAAFGGSCATGNTTQSTDGTILHREAVNVMAGMYWSPTPEERIVLSPSGRFIASLETAPDDSIDFRVTAYFEEIGG